jgi:hypothetical protein
MERAVFRQVLRTTYPLDLSRAHAEGSGEAIGLRFGDGDRRSTVPKAVDLVVSSRAYSWYGKSSAITANRSLVHEYRSALRNTAPLHRSVARTPHLISRTISSFVCIF